MAMIRLLNLIVHNHETYPMFVLPHLYNLMILQMLWRLYHCYRWGKITSPKAIVKEHELKTPNVKFTKKWKSSKNIFSRWIAT